MSCLFCVAWAKERSISIGAEVAAVLMPFSTLSPVVLKRIDEDEIASVPVRTHIVRTVKWLRSNGVSQTQLRNSRLERKCFVASVQLNWCVWKELRPVFEDILRQVVIGSTDFIAFPSFSPAVESCWLGITVVFVI